jgi:hypothetical protein
MAFDEAADLIGSCEATLDTLGLLVGDMSEEIQNRDGAWTIAQILKAWAQFYDLRRRHLRRLRSLEPEEWQRSGMLTPIGKISIARLVRHMAAHDAMHSAQIARRLRGRSS